MKYHYLAKKKPENCPQNCHNKESCAILGQCMFDHPWVRNRPEIHPWLSTQTTVRGIANIFTQIKKKK